MKRITERSFRALIVTMCLSALSACSLVGNQAADERWANYQQWAKLNQRPITGDHTGFLGDLHRGREGVREVYVNDIGASTAQQSQGPYDYPVGTIIVKEQYKSMDHWKEREGAALTIMVKVADSTPNSPNDWRWSRGYSSHAKEDPFCSGCHTIAINKDFAFSNGESLKDFQ